MEKLYLSLQIILICFEILGVISRAFQKKQLLKNAKMIKEIRCHLTQCNVDDENCKPILVLDYGQSDIIH